MRKGVDLWTTFHEDWAQERSRLGLANLYQNLETVLGERHIKCEKSYMTDEEFKTLQFPLPKEIDIHNLYFSYHTKTNLERFNLFHIHSTSFPGYFLIDRLGYAGFSSYASYNTAFLESQNEDDKVVNEWFDKFSGDIIDNNITRIIQDDEELKVDKPYFFIAGQTKMDAVVSKLSNVDGQEYYNRICELALKLGYGVVYKPHPLVRKNTLLKRGEGDFHTPNYPNVTEYNGSIHKAISNAEAVYVINSNVGMEALLHGKQVYTAGNCDYKWVTHQIDTLDSIDIEHENISTDVIKKFLYYMVNHVYVDSYDIHNIEKRVDNILLEYFLNINSKNTTL